MTAAPDNQPAEAVFTIARTFDAPRERVWVAWTDPERLAQWWGPKGFAIGVLALDLRPGGVFHYSMTTPQGQEMWGRFVYREILRPGRLVFTNAFADVGGGAIRNPWSADWPLEVTNDLTLAEHDGRTVLTLRGTPLDASPAEQAVFAAGTISMQHGFAGTFDRLAEALAEP